MTAEQIMEDVKVNNIEVPSDSQFVTILVKPDGLAEIAGNATPKTFRMLGMKMIELAVKAEIKAAL